jgi:hypothetical protein
VSRHHGSADDKRAAWRIDERCGPIPPLVILAHRHVAVPERARFRIARGERSHAERLAIGLWGHPVPRRGICEAVVVALAEVETVGGAVASHEGSATIGPLALLVGVDESAYCWQTGSVAPSAPPSVIRASAVASGEESPLVDSAAPSLGIDASPPPPDDVELPLHAAARAAKPTASRRHSLRRIVDSFMAPRVRRSPLEHPLSFPRSIMSQCGAGARRYRCRQRCHR